MGIETAIAAAGIGFSAYGTYKQTKALKEQEAAQQEVIKQQRNIEAQRHKQMQLDAMRRRREIVRQAVSSRAQAQAQLVAQGASGEGSSAQGGAIGGIQGRSGVNDLGIRQNLEIGQSIFDSNQGIYDAYRRSASAGTEAAYGSVFNSIGGAIVKNAGAIARVGEYVMTPRNPSYYNQGGYRVPFYR